MRVPSGFTNPLLHFLTLRTNSILTSGLEDILDDGSTLSVMLILEGLGLYERAFLSCIYEPPCSKSIHNLSMVKLISFETTLLSSGNLSAIGRERGEDQEANARVVALG